MTPRPHHCPGWTHVLVVALLGAGDGDVPVVDGAAADAQLGHWAALQARRKARPAAAVVRARRVGAVGGGQVTFGGGALVNV